MSRIRLYFDEDAMQQSLVVALRARRVDTLTALESGMLNRSDEHHLLHASAAGRVLYSYNVRDTLRSMNNGLELTRSMPA
jgi:hypothetical protein